LAVAQQYLEISRLGLGIIRILLNRSFNAGPVSGKLLIWRKAKKIDQTRWMRQCRPIRTQLPQARENSFRFIRLPNIR
jgi:hypothetical protein